MTQSQNKNALELAGSKGAIQNTNNADSTRKPPRLTSLRYTAPVQKCMVCSNAKSEAVASPTDKRGFVSSEFSRCRHSGIGMVSGGMGLPARMAARLLACLQHPAHPMRVKTLKVALVSPAGAKTMTATTVASASARTPTTNAPTEEERAYALLQALSSASLARLYLHKNNVPAARRQAVLLLKTLQTLEVAA